MLPTPSSVRSAAFRQRRSRWDSSAGGNLSANGFKRGSVRTASVGVHQHVFRRGYRARHSLVDFDRLPKCSRGALETGLHNVVAVLTIEILDVKTDPGILRQRLKPLPKQFCVHFPGLRPGEFDFPDEIRPV